MSAERRPSSDGGSTSTPTISLVAQHRYGEHRAPAVLGQHARRCGSSSTRGQVGHLERLPLQGGPADQRRVQSRSVIVRSWLEQLRAAAVRRADGKMRVASTYSMIDPPSVPVSCTALLTIVVEHLVEVETRADRVADLAQRLQLLDLAGQLGARGTRSARTRSTLRTTIAPCAANASSSSRSRSSNGSTSVRHRREHADDLVLEDHRRREQGAVSGEPLDVLPAVLRVAEDVGDLLGPPVHGHPADQRGSVHGHRMVAEIFRNSSGTSPVILDRRNSSPLRR